MDSSSFSYAFWVKFPEDFSDYSFVYGLQEEDTWSGDHYSYVEIDAGEGMSISVYYSQEESLRASIDSSFLGIWNHIAVVHDAISGDSRLYINGSPVDNSGTLTFSDTIFNNYLIGPLSLGKDGSSYYFMVDHARIFKTALTDAQIQELFFFESGDAEKPERRLSLQYRIGTGSIKNEMLYRIRRDYVLSELKYRIDSVTETTSFEALYRLRNDSSGCEMPYRVHQSDTHMALLRTEYGVRSSFVSKSNVLKHRINYWAPDSSIMTARHMIFKCADDDVYYMNPDPFCDGSCIAKYPLDWDPSDITGNMQDAVVYGDYERGRFHGAVEAGGEVDLAGNHEIFDWSQPFALSIWLKWNGGSNQQFVECASHAQEPTILTLGIRSGGTVRATIGYLYPLEIYSVNAVETGKWSHIVVTSAGKPSVPSLYVNGVRTDADSDDFDGEPGDKCSTRAANRAGAVCQIELYDRRIDDDEATSLFKSYGGYVYNGNATMEMPYLIVHRDAQNARAEMSWRISGSFVSRRREFLHRIFGPTSAKGVFYYGVSPAAAAHLSAHYGIGRESVFTRVVLKEEPRRRIRGDHRVERRIGGIDRAEGQTVRRRRDRRIVYFRRPGVRHGRRGARAHGIQIRRRVGEPLLSHHGRGISRRPHGAHRREDRRVSDGRGVERKRHAERGRIAPRRRDGSILLCRRQWRGRFRSYGRAASRRRL